tara:strand:+ start:698 stop:880 length:183 start_codon:yes stop_codon:yes gene_type:complete
MTNAQAYTEALMLAIVAPTDDDSQMAMQLAQRAATAVSEHDQNLCRIGIETCMEYLRQYP